MMSKAAKQPSFVAAVVGIVPHAVIVMINIAAGINSNFDFFKRLFIGHRYSFEFPGLYQLAIRHELCKKAHRGSQ